MNDLNSPSRLAASWIADCLDSRDEVVSALTATSDTLSGAPRWRLRRLADEIAFLKTADDVLRNPMALEIFLLLADRRPFDGAFSVDSGKPTLDRSETVIPGAASTPITTELAVNRVLLSHLPIRAGGQRILTMLAYPLAVLLICGLVLAVFSWQLVPPFKSMYDEFGLQLPVFTKLLFQISDVVQSPLTYLGLAAFLGCVGLFVWLQYGSAYTKRGNTSPVSFHGSGLRSTRGVWADWAWHVSLLLRAGLDKADAMEIAGNSSGQVWLRRGAQVWSQSARDAQSPFRGVTHFRGETCTLLADALSIDEDLTASVSGESLKDRTTDPAIVSLYQAGVLRDIAEIYWERDQQRTLWRLGWVSPLAVIGIGFVVLFVVFALFAPLVELITGLT